MGGLAEPPLSTQSQRWPCLVAATSLVGGELGARPLGQAPPQAAGGAAGQAGISQLTSIRVR